MIIVLNKIIRYLLSWVRLKSAYQNQMQEKGFQKVTESILLNSQNFWLLDYIDARKNIEQMMIS